MVTFADGGFPDLAGLLGYVERLKGPAKLRPDSKMSSARDWPTRRGAAQRRAAAVARPGAGGRGRAGEGAGAGLGGVGHARRERSAPARPRRARRRRGSPGRGRSPSRRAAASWPALSTPSTTTFRSSSRASAIIALTTIRSRLPPTMSAIRPRSILSVSSGKRGEIGEVGIAGAEIVDRDLRTPRRAGAPAASATAGGRRAGAFGDFDGEPRADRRRRCAISSSSQSSIAGARRDPPAAG